MVYIFYNNCVGTQEDDVPALIQMIDDAIDITRRTFLKHIDREELADIASGLSYFAHYKQGLTMAKDWHVSYHRSKWKGERCYFFCHSGIEYYFLKAA